MSIMLKPIGLLKLLGKAVGYSSLALTAGGTVAVLHRNQWDVSSLGAVRFARSAKTAALIVRDYKTSLKGLDPKSREHWDVKSQVHRRSAERLRDLCCLNKGAYIKVGQHLGALEYLLPIEYVETMRVLHSDAPQSPKEDMLKVIQEEFGKEVSEVFTSFADKPVGAASLAQVHKATLKDGTVVAVKIQHPKVKAHAFVDMATMELLVRVAAKIFPEFQLMWLAEETKKNLPKELDFVHEAKNCERVGKMFAHCKFLKIPKVYWDLTTERVLTMEYCEGGQVNDKEFIKKNKISVNEVSKKLGELYSEMIFIHGYIHCDPHPGNILVNKKSGKTQLVLLDHGLYQTLTDEFRVNYCKLWRSILQVKLDGIKKYSERLGIGRLYPLLACMVTGRSWNAITKGVDKQSFTEQEDEEIKSNAASYLPEISDILNHVPRQMLLIFKTNDLLRGIETTLETRANASSFITMSRVCVQAVYRYKRWRCNSLWCQIKQRLREQYYLLVILVFEFTLWLRDTPIGRRIISTNEVTDAVKSTLKSMDL